MDSGVNSFTLRRSCRFKKGVGGGSVRDAGRCYLIFFFFCSTLRGDGAQLGWRRGRIYAPRSSARADGWGDKRDRVPHRLTEAGWSLQRRSEHKRLAVLLFSHLCCVTSSIHRFVLEPNWRPPCSFYFVCFIAGLRTVLLFLCVCVCVWIRPQGASQSFSCEEEEGRWWWWRRRRRSRSRAGDGSFSRWA